MGSSQTLALQVLMFICGLCILQSFEDTSLLTCYKCVHQLVISVGDSGSCNDDSNVLNTFLHKNNSNVIARLPK